METRFSRVLNLNIWIFFLHVYGNFESFMKIMNPLSHLKKKEYCDDDKTVLPTFLTEHFNFFRSWSSYLWNYIQTSVFYELISLYEDLKTKYKINIKTGKI